MNKTSKILKERKKTLCFLNKILKLDQVETTIRKLNSIQYSTYFFIIYSLKGIGCLLEIILIFNIISFIHVRKVNRYMGRDDLTLTLPY